jgi:hypothetical protein
METLTVLIGRIALPASLAAQVVPTQNLPQSEHVQRHRFQLGTIGNELICSDLDERGWGG